MKSTIEGTSAGTNPSPTLTEESDIYSSGVTSPVTIRGRSVSSPVTATFLGTHPHRSSPIESLRKHFISSQPPTLSLLDSSSYSSTTSSSSSSRIERVRSFSPIGEFSSKSNNIHEYRMFPRRKSPTDSFDPLSPVPSRGSPEVSASPESETDDDSQSTYKRHKSISEENLFMNNHESTEKSDSFTGHEQGDVNNDSNENGSQVEASRQQFDYEEREKQVNY